MNDLQVFNNPEFGQIRTTERNGEPWFVGRDVAQALGYGEGKSLANAVASHVDDEDKGVTELMTPGGMQKMVIINESGLYSLVLGSKLPAAKKFKRWITHEVIPSIRRTGSYSLPKNYPSALRALADAEEQRLALTAETAAQRQIIAEYEPKVQYVDKILSSRGTLTVKQIAADYGLTAQHLNNILHEERVQYKVNDQWLLYQKYLGMGYTKSESVPIVRYDGQSDFKLHTRWTQKGRLFIHELLTRRGIQASMDKDLSA